MVNCLDGVWEEALCPGPSGRRPGRKAVGLRAELWAGHVVQQNSLESRLQEELQS